MKAVQHFSEEYLKTAAELTPTEIARFLDDFQRIHEKPDQSVLISIRIPRRMLQAFRRRCEMRQTPYQSEIKRLMAESLRRGEEVDL